MRRSLSPEHGACKGPGDALDSEAEVSPSLFIWVGAEDRFVHVRGRRVDHQVEWGIEAPWTLSLFF